VCNSTGWKYYTYEINASEDATPPTLDVNPSSGTLSYGNKITIKAIDDSGINHIGYVWNQGKTTHPVYNNKAVIEIEESLPSGTNKLYIYAKDNSSNHNSTGWKYYTYEINSKGDFWSNEKKITIVIIMLIGIIILIARSIIDNIRVTQPKKVNEFTIKLGKKVFQNAKIKIAKIFKKNREKVRKS
jgi:hypothetical protein